MQYRGTGNPDPAVIRRCYTTIMDEAATWEAKYDWVSELTEAEREEIRQAMARNVVTAQRGMGDHSRFHGDHEGAIDWYQMAAAGLDELPLDAYRGPDGNQRMRNTITVGMAKSQEALAPARAE